MLEMKFSGDTMSYPGTTHTATFDGSSWRVSYAPKYRLSEKQARTALVLARQVQERAVEKTRGLHESAFQAAVNAHCVQCGLPRNFVVDWILGR